MASRKTHVGTIDHEYNRRAYHLRRLKFSVADAESAYAAYLESELWRAAQDRYAASGRPMYCFVCGKTPTDLHHITYGRLGFEAPEDLIRLCSRHHKSTSTLVDIHRYGFARAHEIERRTVWQRRWRTMRPEVMERIKNAQGTRLKFDGPIIEVFERFPTLHLEPIVLTLVTDGSVIKIYITFPDGPGESRFALNTKR